MNQLILLPGLASNHVMWQAQLAALPDAWSAHVTDVHARCDSIEAMARTLLQEHPGELVLCGASMGGIVAMEVAHQAPHRIRGLALLGSSARPESDDTRALREAAIVLFDQGRAAEVLRANVPLAFHPSRSTDKDLVQRYLDFVLEAGVEQLTRQNRAIMARPDARRHLPNLHCPVLMVCGDADQLTPVECAQEIVSLIPQARLEILAQCGHMLTMEQPEQVNVLLRDWLATLPPLAQEAA